MNFPEGVHYLSSECYEAGRYFGLNVISCVFIVIFVIGCLLIGIGSIIKDIDLTAIGRLTVALMGLFLLLSLNSNIIYNTQYIVTVEKFVPFSKITENYDIISIKDNLVTIRPHEPVPWENGESS